MQSNAQIRIGRCVLAFALALGWAGAVCGGTRDGMSLLPDPHEFGAIAVGSTVRQTFTLENLSADTEVSLVNFGLMAFWETGDPTQFKIVGDNSEKTLGPGESRQIEVEFAPTSPGRKYVELWALGLRGGPANVWTILRGGTEVESESLSAANTPFAEVSGDPVQTATGEFLIGPDTDIDLGGPLPVSFTRWYATRLRREGSDLASYGLGENWTHNFALRAESITPSAVKIVYERGKRLSFARNGGVWERAAPQEVLHELKEDTTGDLWLLHPARRLVYRFDGVSGRLLNVMDQNANRLTLTYGAEELLSVSDGLGRTLAFAYSAAMQAVTNVTDGTRNVAFSYVNDRLVTATDPMGDTTTYVHGTNVTDNGVLIVAIDYPAGNRHNRQRYDAQGRVVEQTDAYSNTTTFAFDTPVAGTTRVRNADGSERYTDHAELARMTRRQDESGQAAGVDFDANGRPTVVTDREGGRVGVGYHADSGLVEAFTNANGNASHMNYASRTVTCTNPATLGTVEFTFHDLTRNDYPDGTHEVYAYDASGNRITRMDRGGGTWRYTYNSRGQVLTATNPMGGVKTYAYNADGTLASRRDSDTGLTVYRYDALRRLMRTDQPDGTSRGTAHDLNDRVVARTNENGDVTVFAYDRNGNLTDTTDPLGYVESQRYDRMDRTANTLDSIGPVGTYVYDSMGRLASVIDADGIATVSRYNERGWVTNTTRSGQSRGTAYDNEGVVRSRTSARGFTTTYGTDARGQITNVTDALGGVYGMVLDSAGRVTRSVDPLGHASSYLYDGRGMVSETLPVVGTATYVRNALGQPVAYTNFNGDVWTYGYTPMGRLAAATNALGDVTRHTYDPMGRAVRTDNADGTHTEMTYDNRGWVRTRTDEAGKTWSYVHDHAGRETVVTNPLGGVATTTYHFDGTTATQTDSDRGVTTNRYDALRRLTQTTFPDGASVRYGYDAFSRVTNTVDANGGALSQMYDLEGNLVRETDPAGHATLFAYDALNRLSNRTDRLGHSTAYEYDALDRLVREVDPEGVATEYAYDPGGRRVATTIGGQAWQTGYDNEDAVTSETTPLGHTTLHERDALGSVVRMTDPIGHATRFEYDDMQRLTATVDPLGRTDRRSYEPRGLLSGVSNAVAAAGCRYNGLGLIETLTDPNGEVWTFAYTGMGRLRTQTDPRSRTVTQSWDSRGRLAGTVFHDGGDLAITYDGEGNETNRVHSDGTRIDYEYDSLNRLVATKGTTVALSFQYDAEGRMTVSESGGESFGATYDRAGRIKTTTYANGLFAVTYRYDAASGLLTGVRDNLTGTAVGFVYDADHRLVKITRPNGVHTAYTWDSAARLVRIQDANVLDLDYELDAAGEVVGARIMAPLSAAALLASQAETRAFDAAAQTATAGYAFDVRGRQTAAPGSTYTWNDAAHLTRASNPSHTTDLTYDGLGNPATRTRGAATTRFYYNHAIAVQPVMAERDGTGGSFQRYYVWTPDGELLYMIDAAAGNAVRHYHFDRMGSVLALTDTSGAVTDAYAYTPYGVLLAHAGSSEQPLTYAGEWGVRREGDGELYRMGARHYDAAAGRFLSRDPVWPVPDVVNSLNPYNHALMNPVRFGDPRGTFPVDLAEAAGEGGSSFKESGRQTPGDGADGGYFDLDHGTVKAIEKFVQKTSKKASKVFKSAKPALGRAIKQASRLGKGIVPGASFSNLIVPEGAEQVAKQAGKGSRFGKFFKYPAKAMKSRFPKCFTGFAVGEGIAGVINTGLQLNNLREGSHALNAQRTKYSPGGDLGALVTGESGVANAARVKKHREAFGQAWDDINANQFSRIETMRKTFEEHRNKKTDSLAEALGSSFKVLGSVFVNTIVYPALDVVGLTEPGFETAGARLGELYPADGRSGWDLEPQGSPEWKRQIRRDAKPVNPMDHQGRAPGRYGSSYGLGGVTVTRSGHAYAN
jgi:RHS repeat-associated protein